MRAPASFLVLLALTACTEPGPTVTDEDGDGFALGDDDCDDADPLTHVGAPEDCTEVDRNCDGDPLGGVWWAREDVADTPEQPAGEAPNLVRWFDHEGRPLMDEHDRNGNGLLENATWYVHQPEEMRTTLFNFRFEEEAPRLKWVQLHQLDEQGNEVFRYRGEGDTNIRNTWRYDDLDRPIYQRIVSSEVEGAFTQSHTTYDDGAGSSTTDTTIVRLGAPNVELERQTIHDAAWRSLSHRDRVAGTGAWSRIEEMVWNEHGEMTRHLIDVDGDDSPDERHRWSYDDDGRLLEARHDMDGDEVFEEVVTSTWVCREVPDDYFEPPVELTPPDVDPTGGASDTAL